MGSEKVKLAQDRQTKQDFMARLLADLKALDHMLENDMFETGVQRIGMEQELGFVDFNWRPAPIILDVLKDINDEHFTTELARFNMEINLDPEVLTGNCFSTIEKKLTDFLNTAEQAANKHNAHILLAGIVPSIRRTDINMSNMTPLQRYKYLLDYLAELRESVFEFRISGTDELITKDTSAMFEGANTSFQVHYQVEPDDFVAAYNWSQAVTGPLLAACTNSPLLVGKRLWRETRIALFQQSTDTRNTSEYLRDRMPRVAFGNEWIRNSVLDIYRDSVTRYKILLCTTQEEDPMEKIRNGIAPKLYALNIHNGTIWSWNRACYGHTDGKPHLRIENRVLPAGPTIKDEIANSAFWIGLMKGMPDHYKEIYNYMRFDAAKTNFMKAATEGLGAHFIWPGHEKRVPARELILDELLPIAYDGLNKANINPKDRDYYLDIIAERVKLGHTGSQWMLASVSKLAETSSKDEAIVGTTAGLYYRQQKGDPVHTWDLPEIKEAGDWKSRYWTVEQIMATDLVTVHEEELVDLVYHIMNWKNIRHVPVENNKGELVGLISSKTLVDHFCGKHANKNGHISARDIMVKELLTIPPSMHTIDAIGLMKENNVSCLPVVSDNQLLGLVTEYDFVNVSAQLLRELDDRG